MRPQSSTTAPDTGFTLDEAAIERRKSASAQRVHTLQIPAVRAAGFVILCGIALVHDLRRDPAFPSPELLWLLAINVGYAAAAGLLLRLGYRRGARVDLSMVLFHADIAIWLLNLHHLETGQPFFAYFLLVRVIDQIGFGFRRALYFAHGVTLAYLAYTLAMAVFEPARALWSERVGIAAMLYLLGWYFAIIGQVADGLRQRTRHAMRAARALVSHLERKAQALQAQAVELEQARHQAEQASLAKSQFLAVISHEIRTPMNGILGAAELLIGSEMTAAQQRHVRTAHHSATALLALIDDVLDLSRIEAGRMSLSPASVDLRSLVSEAVELVEVTARDKPITLSSQIDPELPRRVQADPLRLRQLIVNLLHNAVKFTERGTVTLSLQLIGVAVPALVVRLSVRDTGIGIARDALDSIFEAFTQVDGSSTRRHGGSGLGLAIVKELAALMGGGTVQVESQLGVGSHFWVDLPLPPAIEPERIEAPMDADDDGAVSVAVLLVDDDPVNQIVTREMLQMLGCDVEVADDGDAGWRACVRGRPDIVFMDCHMPVMDGYEATRRIREAEQRSGERVPIIALTADTLASDRERCIQAGMDGFMTKPVSSSQLSAAIARWTGRRTYRATQW